MIYLTKNADSQIKQIAISEGIGHHSIRVKVIGGGCAGFSYDMYFDDKSTAMDEVFEIGDIKIIIDPLSIQYLDEMTIDYLESPLGGGFKFNNPNIKGSCGCGSSFSA